MPREVTRSVLVLLIQSLSLSTTNTFSSSVILLIVDNQYNITMNYIQKAWLKVLSPVIPFINEKLAKRSGLLGKLGRFFAIGPREFGAHPSSKIAAFMNRYFMGGMAMMFHRYSFWKYDRDLI